MNNTLMGLTTAAIVFMIHFAVVDFRFRVAGGMMGIWGRIRLHRAYGSSA